MLCVGDRVTCWWRYTIMSYVLWLSWTARLKRRQLADQKCRRTRCPVPSRADERPNMGRCKLDSLTGELPLQSNAGRLEVMQERPRHPKQHPEEIAKQNKLMGAHCYRDGQIIITGCQKTQKRMQLLSYAFCVVCKSNDSNKALCLRRPIYGYSFHNYHYKLKCWILFYNTVIAYPEVGGEVFFLI